MMGRCCSAQGGSRGEAGPADDAACPSSRCFEEVAQSGSAEYEFLAHLGEQHHVLIDGVPGANELVAEILEPANWKLVFGANRLGWGVFALMPRS